MKTAHLLGLFLLASCSAETGAETPPSSVDAGHEAAGDEPLPDAVTDKANEEEGGAADASVDVAPERRSPWDDALRPVYDGPPLDSITGNWLDAPRGPDGQCILHPNWSAYVDIDPVTGMVTCREPPGTWQYAVCQCVIEWLFPDGGNDP
jgi:hypothetical protein